MTIESDVFKRQTIDFNKLIDYGFSKKSDKYVIEKSFMDNNFKAVITVDKKGAVTGKVYDVENDDEFLPLRVENNQGSFVADVRTEYENILNDICQNCSSKNLFIYPQANRIAKLIYKKYKDTPQFLWEDYPTYGVFKNPDSNKWYGLIGSIDFSKINKNKKGETEFINIKLDAEEIQALVGLDGFYPAWHMNKKSWITLSLDETIPDEKIMELIEESYSYTIKKKKNMRK